MTFRRLYLVYALIMSAVIVSIVFNKGAMFREILRDGIPTTGKVTSLQREFPRGDARIRVRPNNGVRPYPAGGLTRIASFHRI
jgi:hypothetical protein